MPRHYRPGLDVVRLAALLPVLCYHYCIEAARLGFAVPTALISRGMADWVELGLAWFFLLSGAALCLQWQGRFALRRYLAGRAAATYPAFWLGFAALFLYGEVLHGNNADIPRWRVIFSLLGLDGYLTPVTVTFYKIGEWFLGVILILYLVFPLLLWCIETPLRRRALAACMAVLAIVWPLICPAPWEAGHTVLGRLPAFALGVWFGSFLQKDAAPPKWLTAGLLTLPLMWDVARRIGGKGFALTALFLLALNPWHMVLSRWALEANMLPHVVLLAAELLLIGTRISGIRLSELRDKDYHITAALRLIVLPLILYVLLLPLHLDPAVWSTLYLLTAMPCGTLSAMQAELYGGDSRFAARAIAYSTLLSLATVPVMSLLLG